VGIGLHVSAIPPRHAVLLPFPELVRPLAEGVAHDVRAGCAGLPEAMTGPVAEAAASLAATRLGALAAGPLHAAFARSRPPPPAISAWLDQTPETAPRTAHDAFVAAVARGGGIVAACPDHPALGPALARCAADIASAAAEMAVRLHRAAPRLARAWPGGVLPPLAAVTLGLGDPHAGGRSVARLRFADGRSLAYKPRSLQPERAFHRLQRWLARQAGGERHRIPWTLPGADHGWMAWLESSPCRSEAEAARFFRRAGSLLALLRCVAGGDVHSENLIACGEWPVPVDLECLVQPGIGDRPPADDATAPPLFSTGLLPVFASRDGGASFEDMGGLSPATAGRTTPTLGWAHIGTDWQRPALVAAPLPECGVPAMADSGRPLRLADFAEPFAAGYAATLGTLLHGRPALLAPRGPFTALARIEARLLVAPTQAYARLLETRIAAGGDGNGRAAARLRERPPLLPIPAWGRVLAAEEACLARLDVPRFAFRPGGTSAAAVGGSLGRAFTEPPLAAVSRAFTALRAGDVEREAALLRRVFASPAEPRRPVAAPREVLRRIAEDVAGAAVENPDGTVDWVRAGMDLPIMPRPAEPGLGYGTLGIGLMLAEAALVLGDAALEALARRALLRLRREVTAGRAAALGARFGAGQGRGLGGMLTGLVHAAGLLDDPALLGTAAELAESGAGAALAAAAGEADLHDGAAGLLLGLDALRIARGGASSLPAMRACGTVIEAALVRSTEASTAMPLLAGLAHGASGMAVAASTLRLVSGEGQWGALAARLLRHEAGLFDAATRNWRDLRPRAAARPPWTASWCHGAPGIALARHALLAQDLHELARLPLAQELEVARATTMERLTQDLDDLCCGDAGRITILLALGDSTATREIGLPRIAEWGTGRARLWSGQLDRMASDPCLFKGLAGLCQALVQMLAPEMAAPVLLSAGMRCREHSRAG
jgi:type 2 lantibiotic biosynthesis protein LanM